MTSTRHSPDFRVLLRAEEDVLVAKLKAARAALPMHEPEKGAALERAARDFLRSFLPNEYGLGTGFIAWIPDDTPSSRPQVSPQLDIIIYDALRGSAIADLGSAQVYPIESVYGYVEIKTSLRENLEQILRVSAELRHAADRRYLGPATRRINGRTVMKGLHFDSPNTTRVAEWTYSPDVWPQLRISPFAIAFEYARGKHEVNPAELIRHFEDQWRAVDHPAHLYGVIIAGVGFLRSLPDPNEEHPFRGEFIAGDAVARFKSQMLVDLTRKFRTPDDLTVNYARYLDIAYDEPLAVGPILETA